MKVAVIGATGRTGQAMLAELLKRGYDVVLVRDPAKLGDTADKVQVVQGSSTDRSAMSQLVAGTDAVLSALDPRARSLICTQDGETARRVASAHTGASSASAVGHRCPRRSEGPGTR